MNTKAVIGCGFGDEGKGKVVSSLCSQAERPLVIRYSGGQQAGHRVVLENGQSHIFSNFSSGSLQGADTYWSKFCTVDPVGVVNEMEALRDLGVGVKPWLYINADCPITTPYEKRFNRNMEDYNKHGTCGVGVGQTYQREQDHFSIKARDLLYKNVFVNKIELLRKYYDPIHHPESVDIEIFMIACNQLMGWSNICIVDYPKLDDGEYSDIIFEGSQGLLLDESIGFFPHVTRGHTGTQNILDIDLTPHGLKCVYPEIYLVTRAYQTRHGAGPMTNEEMILNRIPDNPHEHNKDDGAQGVFRKTVLDVDLLKYAIESDEYIRECPTDRKTLVITCVDVLKEFVFTAYGRPFFFDDMSDFARALAGRLGFERYIMSASPVAGEWKEMSL